MDKTESKYRDIQFYSEKNQMLISVHTRVMQRHMLISWRTAQMWQDINASAVRPSILRKSPAGIRPDYFEAAWASDFRIENADGSISIRK